MPRLGVGFADRVNIDRLVGEAVDEHQERSTESTDTRFVADDLDRLLFAAFPGLVMRKGLTKIIRGTSKAPSYVIEFMLGKYCANLFDDEEVREGLRLVQEEVAAYIMIELGPRQTGKSFCVTEFSPYGTLLAGGAITVPKLYVTNTSPPRLGLIALRDVVGFDEIAGSAFNADDDKKLYKSYMELGRINRGTIMVAGDAGFVRLQPTG